MSQSNIAMDGKKPQRGLFRSIRTKLIVSFSLLFVAVLAMVKLIGIMGVPFTSYSGRQGEQRKEAFKNLNLIAALKKERLLRWMEERRDDIHVTATNDFTVSNVVQLRAVIHELAAESRDETELWRLVREEGAYKALVKYLDTIRNTYRVYDRIRVDDAGSGKVVVSTDDTDLGTDVSELSRFNEPLRTGAVYVSDIEISPQMAHPTLHFSDAIESQEGKVVAVLVMEVNTDDIIRPMLHTGEGLGERGEALLVNRDVKILTSLKHPLADGSIAEPLEYQIAAKPAVFAASGEEGIIESEDYRGEPVLSAYRHIRLNAEWGWGMVVKRDKTELFAPLRQDIIYSLFISLVGIFAIVGLTIVIASNLTRPMLSLSQTANQVAEGNLAVRVPVMTSDEVGMLATTFNAMVQRIQNWRKELEKQVRARTAELKESEERYRTLVETMNDGLTVQNEEYFLTYANDRFCEILGRPRDEIIGRSTADFHDEASRNKFMEQMPKRQKGESARYEITFVRPDGSNVHTIASAMPMFDDEGNFQGSFAVITDITERVRAEEELRLHSKIIANMAEGVNLVRASDGVIVYVNPIFEEIFGYGSGEMIGKHISIVNAPTEKNPEETVKEIMGILDETGEWQGEINNIKKDGTLFWCYVNVSMFDHPIHGRVLVAVQTDITERKQAAVEREVLIEELEAKNAELERFTYTVSHDLKSPLITIKGFLGLLEQDAAVGDTERMKADTTHISNAVDKMEQLLDELLELSRIGRLVNPSEKVSFDELVREALDMVAGRLADRDVEIEIAPALPAVYGDRSRLREVITNLMDNAAKFMGDQPNPRIEIGVRSDGEETVFYVRDNGIGIEPRYHEKVFDLFDKLEQQTEGTGIGLAIVKRIIEVHGGRIWVESEGAGQGSTFCFTLPDKNQATERE